ncbi:Survival protein SurE-like phosphatase/nucleotidase [Macrophomina phaseolina MS6]|uniref:Survival protein SurE-like phosphatase/nucleotidase n=2 Tax=Macrophomina phaseolina TaxID=35725 RepID=K2S9X2_MACPH|nr:Survival protein SurE-like phosphatase/nucleotidase [Macrophomina phaseolina MS6]KAH7061600.1 survival protein sure-likephosphatase/nucleotidase-like protein [Macrophomina phaseolina]
MRLPAAAAAALALPLAADAIRIIQGNDDGWAEKNVRVVHDLLTAAGHNVVLSAPADNQSGRGSLDSDPGNRSSACEYNSCPANSGPTGTNATNPRLNWVNSYPVTAIRYGIDEFAPPFFDNQPAELAVTGPNVGSNLDIQVPFSGTVGSAVYAVKQGIPAIAFSGLNGDRVAWNAATPLASAVYGDLALNLTTAIIESGTPYLPANTFLNVNFGDVDATTCNDASKFRFVLSRINIQTPLLSDADVAACGRTTLPREREVVDTDGCWVSVSVGDAGDKTTAAADVQAVVLNKLQGLLSCLP